MKLILFSHSKKNGRATLNDLDPKWEIKYSYMIKSRKYN